MHIINQNTLSDGRAYLHPRSSHHENTHYRSSSGDSQWKVLFGSHARLPASSCDGSTSGDGDGITDPRHEFLSDEACEFDDHNCDTHGCKRITINVSGLKFETQLRTLNRLPNTLLGNPTKRKKYWDSNRKEFFFDRHRPSFSAILYFYQSGGRLKRPMEVPSDIFLNELQFFDLGKSVLSAYKMEEGFIINTDVPVLPEQPLQRKVWELFEYPDSSIPARVLAIISVIVILVSVTTFCTETLPVFHGTECIDVMADTPENNSTVLVRSIPNFTHPLFIIEIICIAWFSMELVCRLISCPSKKTFLKEVINWIDFASIMPFFVSMALYLINQECSGSKSAFLSVLRVLRVSRILKLSKHSEGLQILGKTMQTSISELVMFALFLGIGVVIFSGAIFYAEMPEPNSHFKSIPDAFWWAVVSMTTVGYGDMYPLGALGKLVGSVTVISGILSIALPVPVIVANFNTFYRHSLARNS